MRQSEALAMRRWIVAVAFLVALAGAARADWQAVERVETYSITGQTGIALYRSIGENGPRAGPGSAIAFTDYKLTWGRDYRPQPDGSCTLVSARPNLVITYRLPEPAGPLPPETLALWERFIAGVRAHERVHGRIITDITKKIEALSIGLTVADDPTCAKTRAELQRRLPPLAEELKRRNRDFDRKEMSEGGTVHRLVLELVNGG